MGRTLSILLAAALAAVVPPTYVTLKHWDELQQQWQVDPGSARGHVIYFTAPT